MPFQRCKRHLDEASTLFTSVVSSFPYSFHFPIVLASLISSLTFHLKSSLEFPALSISLLSSLPCPILFISLLFPLPYFLHFTPLFTSPFLLFTALLSSRHRDLAIPLRSVVCSLPYSLHFPAVSYSFHFLILSPPGSSLHFPALSTSLLSALLCSLHFPCSSFPYLLHFSTISLFSFLFEKL